MPKRRRDKQGAGGLQGGSRGWPGAAPLPASLGLAVPVHSLTPGRFWHDYVSQRRPVLLQGEPGDGSWRAGEGAGEWGDAWLARHAGEEVSAIEVRPWRECVGWVITAP